MKIFVNFKINLMAIFCIFCMTISSCIKQNTNLDHTEFIGIQYDDLNYSDSCIEINLNSQIIINWDNKKFKIVVDSNYRQIEDNIEKYMLLLIDKIKDTSLTNAKVCGYDNNLSTGQIAFLLLDKIKKIPYAFVFDYKFDLFSDGCKFPIGFIDFILEEREIVSEKVYYYLKYRNCN